MMSSMLTQLFGNSEQFKKNILTVVRKFRTTAVGRVSHQEAIEKATTEFKKYQVKTLSTVEEDYLRTLKSLEKKLTN